jgi:hypothetical protein
MTYTYLKTYNPKDIEDQIVTLRKHFPKLKEPAVPSSLSLPESAEAWFAIPRWQKIAKTYNKAVEQVLAVLGNTRDFVNWREGELGADRFRRREGTDEALAKFGSDDILLIPAQFGLRHRGKSVEDVRGNYQNGEFGLGAFEVACMLLTNPERLTKWDDLWIDCPGDEYDYPDDSDRWSSCPCFRFSGGELRFVARSVGSAYGFYGSASGFSSQCPSNLESRTLEVSEPRLILEIGGKRYEVELQRKAA